ncbi:uncharacterized protein [Nicotiana tomentosiformis]|uniref:uncharacterized protein n=1 Tax=Nicotiana tomentosiformis TaxID=4098 RepID=UPI00388C6E0C
MDTPKGKEVASDAQLERVSKIKKVKTSLVAELEKNRQLQEDLKRVKNDFDKSLKCTCSFDVITSMYNSNGGNMQGIWFHKEKAPYNPHSQYVTVPDNWLCTYCGKTGHYQHSCKAKFPSQKKNKVFVKNAVVKGSSKKWYMDSGCSKHMTGRMDDFLSLKALQGGSVSFGNIGKTLSHLIENVYYVNGLKYSMLSVSQFYDKRNKVEFLSKSCTVTNLITGEVVLIAKGSKTFMLQTLNL